MAPPESILPEPIQRVYRLIEENPYFRPPWKPYPKQLLFLSALEQNVLYGGAAFGAKTVAQMMRALLYAHVPGYAAVCFRRTFPELEEPGGFIDLSHQWLSGTNASWHALAMAAECTPGVGQILIACPNGHAKPHQ